MKACCSLLCLFIPASPAHFTAAAGSGHQGYFDVAAAQRLFLMSSGSEPTLWSPCFFMQSQCFKEAAMSVITQRFSEDQANRAKNSPEVTDARCFKMTDTCSAAF